MLLGSMAAMPASELAYGLKFGLGTVTQLVPFQCSTRVAPSAAPRTGRKPSPTAQASDGFSTATLTSRLFEKVVLVLDTALKRGLHAAPVLGADGMRGLV